MDIFSLFQKPLFLCYTFVLNNVVVHDIISIYIYYTIDKQACHFVGRDWDENEQILK